MHALASRLEHILHSYAIPWSIIRKPTYEPIGEDDPYHPMKHILRLEGSFQDRLEEELRVVSWNAFGGNLRNQFLDSLGELCFRENPHVIALQELPDLMLMEEPLSDYHRCYAPTHHVAEPGSRFNFQTCGTAILSRIPFQDSGAFPFPRTTWSYAGKDDVIVKGGTYVRIPMGYLTLGVYSVHFEAFCRPEYRRRASRALFDELDENADDVEIVMGDFSTVWRGFGKRWEPLLNEMNDADFEQPSVNSSVFSPKHYLGYFTGKTPPFFDYVFQRGALGTSCRAERLPGSDHANTIAAIDVIYV